MQTVWSKLARPVTGCACAFCRTSTTATARSTASSPSLIRVAPIKGVSSLFSTFVGTALYADAVVKNDKRQELDQRIAAAEEEVDAIRSRLEARRAQRNESLVRDLERCLVREGLPSTKDNRFDDSTLSAPTSALQAQRGRHRSIPLACKDVNGTPAEAEHLLPLKVDRGTLYLVKGAALANGSFSTLLKEHALLDAETKFHGAQRASVRDFIQRIANWTITRIEIYYCSYLHHCYGYKHLNFAQDYDYRYFYARYRRKTKYPIQPEEIEQLGDFQEYLDIAKDLHQIIEDLAQPSACRRVVRDVPLDGPSVCKQAEEARLRKHLQHISLGKSAVTELGLLKAITSLLHLLQASASAVDGRTWNHVFLESLQTDETYLIRQIARHMEQQKILPSPESLRALMEFTYTRRMWGWMRRSRDIIFGVEGDEVFNGATEASARKVLQSVWTAKFKSLSKPAPGLMTVSMEKVDSRADRFLGDFDKPIQSSPRNSGHFSLARHAGIPIKALSYLSYATQARPPELIDAA